MTFLSSLVRVFETRLRKPSSLEIISEYLCELTVCINLQPRPPRHFTYYTRNYRSFTNHKGATLSPIATLFYEPRVIHYWYSGGTGRALGITPKLYSAYCCKHCYIYFIRCHGMEMMLKTFDAEVMIYGSGFTQRSGMA